MNPIYICFSAFILVVNMHFVILHIPFLACLQACHPTSSLPPTRRVALDSMQKNSLSAMVQVLNQAFATLLRHILCFV